MDNNPLKQYFRRPAVYVKLPSNGIGYPEGSIDMPSNNELPVYPMTAIDEITVRTPDALFNGTAVTELIRSCVPNIKDPWEVKNIDLDALMIAIRTASSELGEMDLDSTCPECEDSSTYKINLAALLASIETPNFDTLYAVNNLKIKFKSLNYKDMNEVATEQFNIQRIGNNIDNITDDAQRNKIVQDVLAKITELTLSLLSKSIEYIETDNNVKVTDSNFILEFLKNCDRKTYADLRDYNISLKEKSSIKPVTITCANCKHEYSQTVTLNPTDFFD